jgi:predicted  nucleic acid-binding Zn-ribbon protein
MNERNIAGELALLATEVDSLTKTLVQRETELADERARRRQAEAEVAGLREQLTVARQRAKTAEREIGKLSTHGEHERHGAEARERDLRERLAQAEAARNDLRGRLEQKERERQALEVNIRELMANLRHAAVKAGEAGTHSSTGTA